MQPRININTEVTIVTLIHNTEKTTAVSSLNPGDIVKVRNYGNSTAKVRILRDEKPLKFGVKTAPSQGGKIDMAINLASHEELDFFNSHSSVTEEYVTQLLINSFPGLWFQGETMPESNSYNFRYKILDVMQQESVAANMLVV